MSIGAVTANPLLSPQMRPNAPAAGESVWSNAAQRPANSAGPPATILPMGATMTLSFETIMNLQSLDEPAPVKPTGATAEEKFLEEARKSPIERMRERILEELGLTEEAIAQMSPDERRATEDKIRAMIEERLREAAGVDRAPQTNAQMIEALA